VSVLFYVVFVLLLAICVLLVLLVWALDHVRSRIPWATRSTWRQRRAWRKERLAINKSSNRRQ